MVGQIYPTWLQSNKVNSPDVETLFPDLDVSIPNGTVVSHKDDKRNDFDTVSFQSYDGDIPSLFHMAHMFLSIFLLQGYVNNF